MLNQHCILCFLRIQVFCVVMLCGVNSSQCSEELLCLHRQSYLIRVCFIYLSQWCYTVSAFQNVHNSTLLSSQPPTAKHETVLQISQPVHWGPTTCTSSLHENSCNIKCILMLSITRKTHCLIIYYLATSCDLQYNQATVQEHECVQK